MVYNRPMVNLVEEYTADEHGSRSAYEIIKEWIFTKRIPPKAKLSERGMAEELGLSRMPVREAFQRLSLEGVLTNLPGRGLCVREYNEQDITDLYLYREALDGMAARIFTIRADSMEINYLKMIYGEMQEMAEQFHPTYWNEKDIEFHTIIARGSRNNRILNALTGVLEECLYISKIFSASQEEEEQHKAPGHLQAVLEEHDRILKAISSGDAEKAERVARESVHDGLERIMKSFVHFNRSKITSEAAQKR